MRIDYFSRVHKGLRTLLFDTAGLVARTDFSGNAPVCPALVAVRSMLGFLREHASHEDAVVLPAILRVAPEVGRSLASEHVGLEQLQRSIDVLVARIDGGGPDRAALGRELDRQLSLLVARHLLHMDREEVEGNAALHAAFGDAAIEAMTARTLAAIAPERMQQWRALIAPTLAANERADLTRTG